MLGLVFMWTFIFPVTNSVGFRTRFGCTLGADCTPGNDLKCRTKYLDEMEEEEMQWEWTEGFGPSEPTTLQSTVHRNGDVTDFTLQWRGPDDSSVRDLQGFQIEFEDGDIFHEYVMDLRGNDLVFQKPNATRITYHMTCHHSNPFSEAVTLRVYVTSLPKSFNPDLTDKVIRGNISIFIPKFIAPNIPRDVLSTQSLRTLRNEETSTTKGVGNIPFIILAIILSFIVFVGIPVFLKFKGSEKEFEDCDIRSGLKDTTPKKILITEETQKRMCQEVCVPFIVEYETMTTLPRCEPCYQHMDSYDSGFHSECTVPFAIDSDSKCETENEIIAKSEKQTMLPRNSEVKADVDVRRPAFSWFHAPPSEAGSMTSLDSEVLEKEILRINKFTTGEDEKG
ncbi:uncharacterized protein LOC133194913 [Saccostrea echinata]|uniref:uncharacterized protein LOC133194913 n=1 Tax=Saccostrea echinata TaxID=191078 RepID=UPI002A80493F|nr:uncharacterized protein LOC133194913 [Saccostrea echinata]